MSRRQGLYLWTVVCGGAAVARAAEWAAGGSRRVAHIGWWWRYWEGLLVDVSYLIIQQITQWIITVSYTILLVKYQQSISVSSRIQKIIYDVSH
jgi:hypothetical protein